MGALSKDIPSYMKLEITTLSKLRIVIMTTFWKFHGHFASIGTSLTETCALYQNISIVKKFGHHLKNPKNIDY